MLLKLTHLLLTHLHTDLIEVALDVSTNGKLPLPPYPEDSPSLIHKIDIFLYSYVTGRNFTITNGTASANNASLGDIMFQEEGSTVKHVKWTWPDCLVGDGQPKGDSDRGVYNVRFHPFCNPRPRLTAKPFSDLDPPVVPPQRPGPLHHLRPAHLSDQQHPRQRRQAVVRRAGQ